MQSIIFTNIICWRDLDISNKIDVLKNGKKVLRFKIKEPKNSKKGEVDILIDSGKGLYFDKVIAGDYFRTYNKPEHTINAVSWHGYYLPIGNNTLSSPKIHLKDHSEKVDILPHLGSINMQEPFALPICSFWIPGDKELNNIGETNKKNSKSRFIELYDNKDTRIDFFVCPKSASAEKVLKSISGMIYMFADIDMFNNGVFTTQEEFFDGDIINDVSGHDVIIRKTHKYSEMFGEEKGLYSLILHDPNDVYNKLLNRPVISIDQNKNKEVKLLRDEFEENMGIQIEERDKIYNFFRNN